VQNQISSLEKSRDDNADQAGDLSNTT